MLSRDSLKTLLKKAKAVIPGMLRRWASRRFLAKIHRITHRMPMDLRTIRPGRVLVLAPHMDDEVIGAGGTLILHRRAGSTLGVVYTTDSGDPASTDPGPESSAVIRAREARATADRLGLEILGTLPFPDGSLSLHEPALARSLAEILRNWAPDQVISPFPADHHRDHQATAAGLGGAIEATGWRGEVWCYEVWSTLWPNVAIDISSVADAKREAIALYASQVAGMSYIESILGLNRFRGLRARVPYAEAYFTCEAQEYPDIAEMLAVI